MAENFWVWLTHHSIEALAFFLVIILGLELVAKHLKSMLQSMREVYLEVKAWKNEGRILPPKT